jgi:hypothetical protein
MVLRTVFAPSLWIARIHLRLAQTLKAQLGQVPMSFLFLMWACGFMNVVLAGNLLSAIHLLGNSPYPEHRLGTADVLQLLFMTYTLLCVGIGFWISAREIRALRDQHDA